MIYKLLMNYFRIRIVQYILKILMNKKFIKSKGKKQKELFLSFVELFIMSLFKSKKKTHKKG